MSKKYEKLKPYLKKIGSGEFTGKSLNREESAEATKLILKEEASPAQIGAFMIAHRIRRPEPEELAGMIDAYIELGPKIYSKQIIDVQYFLELLLMEELKLHQSIL
tara:strand:- start:129 stop:446 length:318 start_codon:yes stop_codon:yes gene_type:complete